MLMELVATGRFLTVLPSFMLTVPSRRAPLKGLPVTLPNARMPVGIITLKNRALSPVAALFIAHTREVARTRARGKW